MTRTCAADDDDDTSSIVDVVGDTLSVINADTLLNATASAVSTGATDTMTATAADSAGNSVGVTTQIQGVVSSVDLTHSPPMLTINGQTYTVNQIKAIIN